MTPCVLVDTYQHFGTIKFVPHSSHNCQNECIHIP